MCVCVYGVHTHISCHVLSNTVTNKNARAVYCCYGYLLRRTLLFASIYLVASDTLAVQVLWLLNHSLITLLKCMYLYVKRYALGHKPFVLISLWGDLGCPTSLITHTLVAIHIRVLNMAVAIAGWREVAQFKVALWRTVYVMLNIQGSLSMRTGSYFVVTDLCAFVLTAKVGDISNIYFFVKCVRLFTSVKLFTVIISPRASQRRE